MSSLVQDRIPESVTPISINELPDLITLEQLANYLQVSKGTLYHWRAEKRGPLGFRISGHLRYRKSDLEQWLNEAAKS